MRLPKCRNTFCKIQSLAILHSLDKRDIVYYSFSIFLCFQQQLPLIKYTEAAFPLLTICPKYDCKMVLVYNLQHNSFKVKAKQRGPVPIITFKNIYLLFKLIKTNAQAVLLENVIVKRVYAAAHRYSKSIGL